LIFNLFYARTFILLFIYYLVEERKRERARQPKKPGVPGEEEEE
jgi:hypothetical protein